MATTAGARFLARERMPIQQPDEPIPAVAPMWEAARMTDETREYLARKLSQEKAA